MTDGLLTVLVILTAVLILAPVALFGLTALFLRDEARTYNADMRRRNPPC